MIVTIMGPPGSGKDTVANRLVEVLKEKGKNYELISMGNLRRAAAKEKGMTIEEFNVWSLDNPKEGDQYFEDYQVEYGKKNDDFVLVARLGWHCIPHSKKIYIDVDSKVGAKRIFDQKLSDQSRNESIFESVEEQEKANLDRIDSDITRYTNLYGVNPYDLSHYDLIIDSSTKDVDNVVFELLDFLKL